ncbi:MAG: CYTH domain-containing protein [Candidatus Azobacteroides sp.]|nr:CYTH domain-containing protein [Candidatus Azobacteroides sp.]
MIEIERKFLIKGDFLPYVTKKERIVQAYLCGSKERTARVRIKGEKAYITIKGPSNDNEFSRMEFEYEIPVEDATEILKFCMPGFIEKVRHYVPCGKHTYEVDVFHGLNEGLVFAELELESTTEDFLKPDWLGEEVTGDIRYYNSYIARHPFKM